MDIVFLRVLLFLLFTPFVCVASSGMNVISIVDPSSTESALIKVYSIVKSANKPHLLHFGFLILFDDANNSIEKKIRNAFSTCNFVSDYTIKHWSAPDSVRHVSNKVFDKQVIYARFYLPHIFDTMDRYLYLDNDVVVNCDLTELYFTSLARDGEDALVHDHNIMGFVFDKTSFYVTYLHNHLNKTHPLVQKLLNIRHPSVFLNGGVALMDAKRWRDEGFTERAEEIIAENRRYLIYDGAISDQGLFALLLQERITHLHNKYNMRRLPGHTVLMLERMELGIVHFGGSTYGQEDAICRRSTAYPYFLKGAAPLYLSVARSLHDSCPEVEWKMKDVCEEGIRKLYSHLTVLNITTKYNPGLGKFTWPPSSMLSELSALA